MANQPVRSSPSRLDGLAEALKQDGSTLLLLGEPGTGKSTLAGQAADALATSYGLTVTEIHLPEPPAEARAFGYVFSRAFPEIARLLKDVEQAGSSGFSENETIVETLLEGIERRSKGRPVLIIAPGIDAYSPASEQLLRCLIRGRQHRIVMTANRITATADRLMHLPHVHTVTLGPLSFGEAQELVSQILHVERVEHATLRRWLNLTEGNAFALSVLVYACDRDGAVHRSRGVAWTNPGHDVVPEEIESFLTDTCTDAELRALELIATAEPVHEMSLIRSIDTEALRSLHERHLVKTENFEGEGPSLRTAHPLLSVAVRSRMQLGDRFAMQERVYEQLRVAADDPERHLSGVRLLRLMQFGLATSQPLPLRWIERALLILRTVEHPRLMVELAVTYAEHPDRDPNQAGIDLTHAFRVSRSVSDPTLSVRILACIRNHVDDERVNPETRVLLRLALIEHEWWNGHDQLATLQRINELELHATEHCPSMVPVVQDLRPILLIGNGDLRPGFDLAALAPVGDLGSLRRHAVSAVSQAIARLQEGRVAESSHLTESAIRILKLEPESEFRLIELNGFIQLLGYWMHGNPSQGRDRFEQILDTIEVGRHTHIQQPGLPDLLLALFTMQEGRLRLATQKAERLRSHLQKHDTHRITALVNAVLANTFAVLGEIDSAADALETSRVAARGMSQAFGGILKLLQAQATLWLHREHAASELQEILDWARETNLPYIELRLIHLIACASGSVSADDLERARSLERVCSVTVAAVIIEHLAWIRLHASGDDLNVADPEIPAVRILASAGILLPQRLDTTLTSREREVALLATLGYSTRKISAMLHISSRTVETHLGRVFQKLGVAGRDELRSSTEGAPLHLFTHRATDG